MRRALIAAVGAAGLMALGMAQPDKKPDKTPDQPAQDEAAQMADMNRLRPEHTQLAELCGVFDVTLKLFPQPGADPTVVKGVSTREMVLGGQFMQERMECKEGLAFTGLSFMGFNHDAKDGPRFEVVRMSSMVNTQMPETGTFDAATKTYTLKGQHEINGMFGRIRIEMNVADPAHQVVTTYLGFEGYAGQFNGVTVPEYHAMTMEYTRR